jgi:hypothetical protein
MRWTRLDMTLVVWYSEQARLVVARRMGRPYNAIQYGLAWLGRHAPYAFVCPPARSRFGFSAREARAGQPKPCFGHQNVTWGASRHHPRASGFFGQCRAESPSSHVISTPLTRG